MKSGRSGQLYLSDWRNETRYHWVRNETLRSSDNLYEKIRLAGKRISFIYVLCQSFSVWAKWMSKERIRKETASRCRPPQWWQGPRLLLRQRAFLTKLRGEESESLDETEKSGLLTMPSNSFSATEGECTRIGFSSLFFSKGIQKNFEEKK